MLTGVSLRKSAQGWKFSSEFALEDFVWNNLTQLLELTPLKRQHPAKGEYCDILALNKLKQLTILELKNTEDRYVVQQLTRYYDNLLDEKPFAQLVDYNQPVQLVAVAPIFHRHNLIDRKYNLLKIDFLRLGVVKNNQDFQMILQDIDTYKNYSIPIPYQELDINSISTNIPEPPQMLLDWLGACNADEQEAILKMRSMILSFDNRIQEEIESKNTILYKGKSKVLAEIYYQKTKSKPIVFLWLPTPRSFLLDSNKQVLGRIRLWISDAVVTHAGHVSKGVGKMKLEEEWNTVPYKERPRNLLYSFSYKSSYPVAISHYKKLVSNPECLERLTNLALGKWAARI